ncbi:MAG: hypothetical protein QOK09_441, partial [Mycobacterium sp.]|nr:hypothetical protein [Mycobacterium sp.]MDT7737072.1 hypothetical protein [Mycobacterium sp.]
MAGRDKSTRTRRSHSATVQWCRRVVGWGSSAGAIVAFGVSPLAGTPAAHADGLDVIVDPIINSIDHAVTGVDALSGLDLAANLDLGGLGGGALDQWLTLPTDSAAGVGAVTDAASGVGSVPTSMVTRCGRTSPRPSCSRWTAFPYRRSHRSRTAGKAGEV